MKLLSKTSSKIDVQKLIFDTSSGWEVKRLKYLAKINPSKEEIKELKVNNCSVTFLPMEKVSEDGEVDTSISKPINEVWDGFTYFRENDVIIAKITPCFENGKGALLTNLENNIGFGSTEFHVLRPKLEEILPKYLYYITESYIFMKLGEREMVGAAGQKRVPQSFLEKLHFPIPSTNVQKVIMDYLDNKLLKIDGRISKKQKLINLLKEELAAIINQAVIKGIDPNVEMKDSAIEWIGEIPKHWEVRKLKYFATTKARLGWKGLKASEYTQSGYGFLATPNIKDNKIDYENINFISEQRYFESPEIMLENGDVVLAKDGSTLGIVNIVTNLPFACTVNSSIAILRVLNKSMLMPEFLRFFFASHYQQNVIDRIKGGMGVPHLFQEDIKNFSIIIPPLSEQKEITIYIENVNSKISSTISRFEKEIELMLEYRTTLISEVLTGKIDVRQEVVS